MLRSKWVMLCPMARSGSSHTSELLDSLPGVRSHHGLFNEGPFGRWPADTLPPERREYYSAVLDGSYRRVGGEERSGEFLDSYIFTDRPEYNRGWECVGFKVQFVHFVHMPDLREYLIENTDVKIIVNTRRHLLEHTCAELWCQSGNSRAAREGEAYEFADAEPIDVAFENVYYTFRNLCRYRQYAIRTFDDGTRDFFEWSYEDMFAADGSLDVEGHRRLFDFLEISTDTPLTAPFARTPRPAAREYFRNYDEIASRMTTVDDGVFAKYFDPVYDPRSDREWPALKRYRLDKVMVEKSNRRFRQRRRAPSASR